MIPGWRSLAAVAGIAGFTAVVAASVGSHMDAVTDQVRDYRAWQSANIIHLLHAAALLGLAALERALDSNMLRISAWLMVLGICLFSGSIYFSIMAEQPGTGGLAPIGGVCLMLAWLGTVVAALRARPAGR